MLNENAKKWVEALRSGEYEQGKHALHRISSDEKEEKHTYCCLGVACELFIKAGNELHKRINADGDFVYEDEGDFLPPSVQKWLGLSDYRGAFSENRRADTLARLNDIGKSFKDIAKKIESEPKGLFA